MSTELKDVDDKALFDLFEKAGYLDKLESDPAWKILREIADRIVEKAIVEFAVKTNPDDTIRIIELQTIIKKYKWAIFDEIERFKNDANIAFQEAQERGIVGDFFASVKAKIGI